MHAQLHWNCFMHAAYITTEGTPNSWPLVQVCVSHSNICNAAPASANSSSTCAAAVPVQQQ